jgi:hypothetical protein
MYKPPAVFIDSNCGGFWIEANDLAEEIIILFIFKANPGADF